MQRKMLWIDTETTGLYPNRNAMIEMACIVEIDGEVTEKFAILFRPNPKAVIEPVALEINGRTEDEILQFPELQFGIIELKKRLSKYVNKYDRTDKFIPAGYNIHFDLGFVRETFVKAGDKFGIGSWCFSAPIDVWTIVGETVLNDGLILENYKLKTLCEHYSIQIAAHDPMSDIEATRALYYLLKKNGHKDTV